MSITTRPAPRPAPAPTEVGLPEQPPVVAKAAGAAEHTRARVDAQLRALLACQDGTRSGKVPEDLHQFRVAIRRLRSLLKTATMFGADGDAVRAELRWIGGVTSPVRDFDVLLTRVRAEVAEFAPVDRAAAAKLVSALVRDRGNARRVLKRALSGTRYANLLPAIAVLATSPVHDADAESDLDHFEGAKLIASLHKPYRKLARAGKAIGDDPPDDELHALRIHGKRLRYAAETAMPTAGKSDARHLKAVVKAAKKLQQILGEHQDAVVAANRLTGLLPRLDDDTRVAFVAGRLVEREHARRRQLRAEWPKVWHRIIESAAPLLANPR